jgi:hypothetical protein
VFRFEPSLENQWDLDEERALHARGMMIKDP